MVALRQGLCLLLFFELACADPVNLTGIASTKNGKLAALLFFPNSNYGLRIVEGQERLGIKLLSVDLTNGRVQIRRNETDETLQLGGETNKTRVYTGLIAGTPTRPLQHEPTEQDVAAANRRVAQAVKGLHNPGANDPEQAAEYRNRLMEQAAAEAKALGSEPPKPVFDPSDQ